MESRPSSPIPHEDSSDEREPRQSELIVGAPVEITAGRYKGSFGFVERFAAKGQKMVYISCPQFDKAKCLMKTSVRVRDVSAKCASSGEPRCLASPKAPIEDATDTLPPTALQTPASETARKEPTANCADTYPTTALQKPASETVTTTDSGAAAAFRLPNAEVITANFGSNRIEKLVVAPKLQKSSTGTTFNAMWGGGRMLTVEHKLPLAVNQPLEPIIENFQGFRYELVTAKVHDGGSVFHGIRKESLRMTYAAVAGEGITSICLREVLDDLAGFRYCDTVRKAATRLKMYDSRNLMAFRLKADEFEIIAEPHSSANGKEMHDGCGFISERAMLKLIPGRNLGSLAELRKVISDEGLQVKKSLKKGERTLLDLIDEIDAARAKQTSSEKQKSLPAVSSALRLIALQHRVFGPKIGCVKGVLVRKPFITNFQIVPSMVKVRPKDTSHDDEVSIIIKLAHPSDGNREIGKILQGKKPSQSFLKRWDSNMLCDMIARLWLALGVPEEVILAYRRKPLMDLSHAWLLGAADPTDGLPAGHIFVSGLSHKLSSDQTRLFVTRSPCVKPSDGRMLPVVMAKPDAMEQVMWEWLRCLPFGAVFFSSQGDGHGFPLPGTIADGDLDGDLYFTCWDSSILSHVNDRELLTEDPHEPPVLLPPDHIELNHDDTWLEQVQRHMTNAALLVKERQLIGRLYNAHKRIAEENGLDDPDALAFGAAYVQALERDKHGGAIHLPTHLHDKF